MEGERRGGAGEEEKMEVSPSAEEGGVTTPATPEEPKEVGENVTMTCAVFQYPCYQYSLYLG